MRHQYPSSCQRAGSWGDYCFGASTGYSAMEGSKPNLGPFSKTPITILYRGDRLNTRVGGMTRPFLTRGIAYGQAARMVRAERRSGTASVLLLAPLIPQTLTTHQPAPLLDGGTMTLLPVLRLQRVGRTSCRGANRRRKLWGRGRARESRWKALQEKLI